jgi:hypothetical protein
MSLELISRLNLGAAFRIDLRLTFVLSHVMILLLWFWGHHHLPMLSNNKCP